MINLDDDTEKALLNMGHRLKDARLANNESQEIMAARLGISRQTYSKMEKGEPTIAIGHWLMACSILDSLDIWDKILKKEDDLFAMYDRQQHGRKKAGRPRSKK